MAGAQTSASGSGWQKVTAHREQGASERVMSPTGDPLARTWLGVLFLVPPGFPDARGASIGAYRPRDPVFPNPEFEVIPFFESRPSVVHGGLLSSAPRCDRERYTPLGSSRGPHELSARPACSSRPTALCRIWFHAVGASRRRGEANRAVPGGGSLNPRPIKRYLIQRGGPGCGQSPGGALDDRASPLSSWLSLLVRILETSRRQAAGADPTATEGRAGGSC